MDKILNLLKQRKVMYLLFLLIILAFYGNTLINGFVYDDVFAIQKNELIRNINNLPKILFNCVKVYEKTDCRDAGIYYRPLLFLQLMLVSQISSSPWFFHLINLGWFFIDSILVYKLLEVVLRRRKWALLGTLIFLIHPINSEVVNFVSVNDHLLLTFFILTFLSFNTFVLSKRYRYLALTLGFYFLTFLAKESAIVLFIPILIYQLYVVPPKLLKIISLPKLVLILVLPIIVYIILRLAIFGNVFGSVLYQQPGYHNMSLPTQIFTSVSLYPLYLFKLVYPLPLNAQHDPTVITIIDYRFWISLGFWVVNGYLIYLALKRGNKLAIFGFSLIFLPLLPILILVNKVGRFILSERYLLLSTVGFSIVVIDLCLRAIKLFSKEIRVWVLRIGTLGLILLFLVSWLIVFNRNKDWKDELSFDKSIARYTQENYGVHYNLGVLLAQKGDQKEAVISFKKALEINPDFWEAHYNLGNAYTTLGRTDLATKEYRQVLAINPDFAPAKKNLVEYSDGKFSFSYPKNWTVNRNEQTLIIKNQGEKFKIEMKINKRELNTSIDDYLKKQSGSYGRLINQGLAQVSNMDFAYVKIWQDGQVKKMEFFLFKSNVVLHIIVGPSDSPQMKVFDEIITSIKL